MNRFFYLRLAGTNLKKNSQIYIPYIITCLINISMFYIMMFLVTNDSLETMSGGMQLKMILSVGSVVIGIFSTIILLYTNSFIMKRRKKEIGLFNILGMGKRHIAKVMTIELLCIAVFTIIIGMGIGVLLSKLMLLLLAKLLGFPISFGFQISLFSIIVTIILFSSIFTITLLSNLRRIHVAQPIELLHGSSTGEKEPKTKWIMTIIGVATLGFGYYIAITTMNPLSAILLFFVAVLLVIAGTYFLFTAVSIAVLKIMKKKKSYYYQTRHFTSISGLLYRMKQHAVGLSNICILSTMVLVMLSGTTCLFFGLDDSIRTQYPRNISVEAISGMLPSGEYNKEKEQEVFNKIHDVTENALYNEEYPTLNSINYKYAEYAFKRNGNHFIFNGDDPIISEDTTGEAALTMLPLAEYNRLQNTNTVLKPDEILLYSPNADCDMENVVIGDVLFKVAAVLDEVNIAPPYTLQFVDTYYAVFSDEEVIRQTYADMSGEKGWKSFKYYCGADIEGSDEEQIQIYKKISEVVSSFNNENGTSFRVYSAALMKSEFNSLYGGLFFLGIFLGIMFIMATVEIMYYKQISEGYEDKKRFEIMQKVGMSRNEVKKTIKSQVLSVFFLPLLVACIHVAAAFNMITRLLLVFGMTNNLLFMICTGITVLIFSLVYVAVYIMTAKAYYRIVRN